MYILVCICVFICVWVDGWMITVRACLRLPSLNTCDNIGSYKTDETLNEQQQVNCCSSLFSLTLLLSASFRQRFTIWDLFIRSFVRLFARSFVCLFICLTVLAAYFHCKLFFLFGIYSADINQGVELEPEFLGSISNVTYPVGREAVLTCSVKNLGKYKVSVIISWLPH